MDSVTQTGLYCSTEKSKAEQQQRSSKRLVTLLSTCGGNEERSPALNTGHCHDKVLRSHTRRANNNTTDNNNAQHTTSGKRLTRNLQNLSCLAQSETEEHDQEYQGNEELCELLSSGERRKRGGGTEWSALRGLIPSSSSCSSTTNETNELTKQAGLGGTPTSKTSTTRTRRTSCATTGARRRSRRGEHCLANNSSTAITTSNSNNSSDSSQIMCSADGGGEEVKNLCNLSEARDDEEMCQEDEQTDPGNCTRSVIHQLNKSLTFKQISPPSRNIVEGSVNLSKPNKTSENENKQESVTVKCVESESEQVQFYVDGEKFSKISKTSQPSGTSNSSVKTHEIKCETDSNSSSKKLGETAPLSYQLSTEKWKVDKGRQHDMQTETNPFSEAIPDNVSMSLLGNSSKAGKASTPSNRNKKSGTATGKKKQVASANYQFTKSSLNGDLATLKVTPEKKKAPVQSPMLLMNNLPYMGELTFDTRPRRGRKPKKADICHLISKNYGIQFPVSCVNIDEVAGTSTLLQPPQTSIPLSSVLSTKPNSQKRSSSSVNATVTSVSSRASSTVTAAAPAFCNKDVSIVPILPTPWSQHPQLGSGKIQEKCLQSSSLSLKSLVKPSLSLAEQLMLCPSNVTARSRSQQTISMIPLSSESPLQKYQRKHPIMCKSEELDDYKDVDVRQCEDEVVYQSDDEEGEGREEIPLNLCMRDDSSNKSQTMNQPLSLCMVKNETKDERHFDVRWKKDESLRMERAQFGGSLGVSKRNMVADGSQDEDVCVRKVGKSAKLSMTQTSSNSSNNFSNHPNISNKVNVLVSQGRIEGLCSAGSNAPAFSVAPSTFSSKNGKQTSSRKKKGETSLRGDISISTQHSAPPFGGTLFGQSTSGINDGAEVSICKFKFTGGAKPSLQEKKMLSVDSGGNFRFYTDKTTPISSASSGMGKGISLDQSLDSSKDCHFALSSLPKSAKSMSICMPLAGGSSAAQVTTTNVYGGNPSTSAASSSANKATNVLQSPIRVQPSNLRLSLSPTAEELQQLHLSMDSMPRGAPSPYLSGEFSSSNSCSSSDNSSENFGNEGSRDLKSQFSSNSSSHRHGGAGKLKRKRRTRKSMMREKLEKTFKEKGFLIQTQQLESAEGATYCKFRQLRKFTRYLFRSWKDYLPDHVKDISDKTNAAASGSPQDVTIPASYPPNSSGCRSPSETEDGKESDLLQDDEDDDEEENMDQDINLDVNDDDDYDDGEEGVYKKEQDLISQTTSKEAKRKEDDQLDEKDKEAGDSESIDEDELNEQRVVLIEASRAKSLLPKSSTLSTPKPKMRLNQKETNDEDEEELQVDL